ncbi:MAG: Clp protease N-terminal domain-containing protein [Planctomycetota bacterium]
MADRHNVLAARALLNARHLARQHAHGWIGTEHLVLGMFSLDEHPVRNLLLNQGVSEEQFRRDVALLAPSSGPPGKATLPLAVSLRETLEVASDLTEAGRLAAISVEHLLLALLNRRAGMGYALLLKQGTDLLDLARELEGVLAARKKFQGSLRFGA